MSKLTEKSLIIKKETIFDQVRERLFMLFFREEYELEEELKQIMKIKKVDTNKIIIPKEIKISKG